MKSGIYSVNFRSNSSDGEGGLVVLHDGLIHGGDTRYLYRGTYESENGKSVVNLGVQLYKGSPGSVFGPLKQFHLNLVVDDSDDDCFTAIGSVAELPGASLFVEASKEAEIASN